MPIAKKQGKKHRKYGRNSRNETQSRYWQDKRLRTRKIRNIVRCSGHNEDGTPKISEREATMLWDETRTKRIKTWKSVLGDRK
jgi:hypothetical protein